MTILMGFRHETPPHANNHLFNLNEKMMQNQDDPYPLVSYTFVRCIAAVILMGEVWCLNC